MDPLTTTKNFIEVSKEIKPFLLPDYKRAAADLYKITNNVFEAQRKMLAWIHTFEALDLRDPNRIQFKAFVNALTNFRLGKGYESITIHCGQIKTIYKNYLASCLTKWFGGNKWKFWRWFVRRKEQEKLNRSRSIFDALGDADVGIVRIVNKVMFNLEDTLKGIEDNYDDADSLRQGFLSTVKVETENLIKQSDELRKLRSNFFELSRGLVSVNEDEEKQAKELEKELEGILLK